jgi:hypothetical protein
MCSPKIIQSSDPNACVSQWIGMCPISNARATNIAAPRPVATASRARVGPSRHAAARIGPSAGRWQRAGPSAPPPNAAPVAPRMRQIATVATMFNVPQPVWGTPEAPFTGTVVQQPAGHFGKPVVDPLMEREHRATDQHVAQVRDDEGRVVDLQIERDRRQHHPGIGGAKSARAPRTPP